VAPSEEEALYWFRRAAARGHAPAQRLLGLAYLAGLGTPADALGARAWLECAAEQGDAEAQLNLARSFGDGGTGGALYWYRRAAEQGAAKAQFTLGVMYANGQGMPRDDVLAVAWYRRAAEQGDASAQNNLGVMYANGTGVPQDDALAVHWYRLAAEQGHALAQYNLGTMVGSGRGVARDAVQSYLWMLLAADAGDPAEAAGKAGVGRRLAREQADPGMDRRRQWQHARQYAGPERRAA
jgi:TPR repeat protein